MMKRALVSLVTLTGLLAAPPLARDAEACGGCFHGIQQSESTQVTGHRMILSLSPQQSTLWDQIEYDGEPASFAWVLPVKGVATVGLSSDALMGTLDELTRVTVSSPVVSCTDSCNSSGFSGTSTSATTGGGGVTVIAQSVVGPYETVQLSSSDPLALSDWLTSHGFVIPADIQPIVATYVAEGFDFLALKLVPGEPVHAMRPVRVTTPGAGPGLPLRMVAAGTGVMTPISLWVIGEGRYEPTNFPWFTIDESELVWDWDTQSSNYSMLRASKFAASNGASWLVEAGEQLPYYNLEYSLDYLVENDVEESGYGDETGVGAAEELTADLETLFAGIDLQSLWVTRLYGELSRPALANDLVIGASPSQTAVDRFLTVAADKTTGGAPMCPPDPCASGTTGITGTGSAGGAGAAAGAGGGQSATPGGDGGGCAVSGQPATAMLSMLLVLGLGLGARRRSARRGA